MARIFDQFKFKFKFTCSMIEISLVLKKISVNRISPLAGCIIFGHCTTAAYQKCQNSNKSTYFENVIHVWCLRIRCFSLVFVEILKQIYLIHEYTFTFLRRARIASNDEQQTNDMVWHKSHQIYNKLLSQAKESKQKKCCCSNNIFFSLIFI